MFSFSRFLFKRPTSPIRQENKQPSRTHRPLPFLTVKANGQVQPRTKPACSRPQRISSFHRDGPKPSRPRTAKESVLLCCVGNGDAKPAGGLALGPLRGGAAEEEAPPEASERFI